MFLPCGEDYPLPAGGLDTNDPRLLGIGRWGRRYQTPASTAAASSEVFNPPSLPAAASAVRRSASTAWRPRRSALHHQIRPCGYARNRPQGSGVAVRGDQYA